MTRTSTTLTVEKKPVAAGNWDTTRKPVDKIIIHTIVGSIAGASARFNKPLEKASAHYGVGLDGKLYQWVGEDATAYHAGKYSINQESIGIEHEDGTNPQTNPDAFDKPRPEQLYVSTIRLIADICKFYSIPVDRFHILKHNEVSATHCPGTLDIERIVRDVTAIVGDLVPAINPEYVKALEADKISLWQQRDEAVKERDEILAKLSVKMKEYTDLSTVYSAISVLGISTAEKLLEERKQNNDTIEIIRRELASQHEISSDLAATISKIERETAQSLDQGTFAQQKLKAAESVISEFTRALGLTQKATGEYLVKKFYEFMERVKKDKKQDEPKSSFSSGTLSPVIEGRVTDTFWVDMLRATGMGGIIFTGIYLLILFVR